MERTRIALRRAELGLTQAQVATAAGISRNTYAAIERGKSRPRLTTAHRLAKVLRVASVWPLLEEA